MRRAGRGGALREGRIAKEAKTRQERRWTARYWAIGGRFGGGWLEATPASSRPGKDGGAPVCCLKITCQVTSSHHLQAELVVARQILHCQQILSKEREKLDKKTYCHLEDDEHCASTKHPEEGHQVKEDHLKRKPFLSNGFFSHCVGEGSNYLLAA